MTEYCGIIHQLERLKLGEVSNFLSSLPLRDPSAATKPFLPPWRDDFPLIISKEAVQSALETWLERLQPGIIEMPTKENQPMVMTSAPTGSGKTQFLRLICDLFRTKWDPILCFREIKKLQSISSQTTNSSEPPPKEKTIHEIMLQRAIDTVNEIKNSPTILKLLQKGREVAQKFLTSTYASFVSFHSTSPILVFETELLGHSPLHMLIARMIFGEIQCEDPAASFEAQYSDFLEKYGTALLSISSFGAVVDFFKKRYDCEHFLLAIDELALLDPEDNEDNNIKKKIAKMNVKTILKVIGKKVMTDPRCAIIVSSLVTGPFDEYVTGSRHHPTFIHSSEKFY